jgi:6-phosphogluconolactonase
MKLLRAALAAALFLVPALRAEKDEYLLYVGTYTRGTSKGIYAYRFRPSKGRAATIGLAAETENPSFLAVHPNQRYLYAVNEVADFEGGNGSVSAFSIDRKSGRLTFLNKASSRGGDPCHVTIDRSGKWLIAANYGSGSVAVLPIEKDGELGPAVSLMRHSGSGKDPRRQEGPHAHSVNLSPDHRILLVSDLGLDKVMIYRWDAATGRLETNRPPFAKLSPGSGPRHLAFHPTGRWVYQINELNSTITAFAYDAESGSLQDKGTVSTLPRGFTGINSTAEVQVHPNGRFVYGSNRGHDSIAVFAIQGDQGMLEPVQYVSTRGKTPRQFAIDPTGNYLLVANQDSDEVVLFRVNRENGTLAPTGTVLRAPMPVCVVFVPRL